MVLEVELVDEPDPGLAEIPGVDANSVLRTPYTAISGEITKTFKTIRKYLKKPER